MTRVSLHGEIDGSNAPGWKDKLYAAIDGDRGAVVVADLSDVQFIDSTGLGMLVGAMKHARSGGGDLRLTRPDPRAWKVFTITGLDKVFDVED